MGKRSDFERVPRDFYRTPPEAVEPLVQFLNKYQTYVEPCAGDGALVDVLRHHDMHCETMLDIEPHAACVLPGDTRNVRIDKLVITNPPWTRPIMHDMIDNWRHGEGCWLLFDADWMHTAQSAPYMPHCHHIVSIGRVKWIPGSKSVGKDNCCWYNFGSSEKDTVFHGR